jgi:hypothetical protein
MTAKSLHDDHTTRLASHACRLREFKLVRWVRLGAANGAHTRRAVHRESTSQEKSMKFAKTTVLAFAVSAALASPVLAQGASSDTQMRGGAQGKTTAPGGMSGSGDEELESQSAAPAQKGSVNAKAGSKNTVGSGHATPPKAIGTESGSKRD